MIQIKLVTSAYTRYLKESVGKVLKHLEALGIVCGAINQYSCVGNSVQYLLNNPSSPNSRMCPRENEACEYWGTVSESLQQHTL